LRLHLGKSWSGIYAGWTVPNEYDPLLGKLVAWGSNRVEAIARMRRAVDEYYAIGIRTNLSLFRSILDSADFQSGAIYTRWLDEFLEARRAEVGQDAISDDAAAVALAMWHLTQNGGAENGKAAADASVSEWKTNGRREQLNRFPLI
jgi:acetyl-CoA carboxylase, biotin carboxylase subunit